MAEGSQTKYLYLVYQINHFDAPTESETTAGA